MAHEPRVQRKLSYPNVIVFGETGVGKSSILNMLEGGSEATVSDQATGVTFSNRSYEKTIKGTTFRVLDTVGLNEGAMGTVAAGEAIKGLYTLIQQLEDGVNLLVYVMRAPRIPYALQQNYEVFFEILCNRRVPIVIVITGLEEREDMEEWWDDNKDTFERRKMLFNGHACITATKGKKLADGAYSYGMEYEESRKKVEGLIYQLAHNSEPWKMPRPTWFATAAIRMRNLLAKAIGVKPKALSRELYDALRLYGGLSDEEAVREAYKTQKKSWKSLFLHRTHGH
jgi:GTP-binding protein EngB required for normal cell division